MRDHPVSFITGASSGIGEALALEYALRGYDVVVCARRLDKLEQVVARVRAAGREALAIECDVTSDDQVVRAFELAAEKFGRLDAVVANAGYGMSGRVENLKIDDHRRLFETNVFGVIRTARAAIPYLRQSRGSLALVGSVMGYMSGPGVSTYAMSKAAVVMLAESLRQELRHAGVSITLVSPGYIATAIRGLDVNGKPIPGFQDPVPAIINMPAKTAARQIVRDIGRRKRETIVTWHGKAAIWIARHLPFLIRFAMRIPAKGES